MDNGLTKDEKKALRQEEWREKADKEKKVTLYKTIGVWAFGGLLVVLGIWALIAFSSGSTTQSSSTITMPKVTSKDFQSGPATAKVTLVEYADFECPACKAYYPIIKQLQADFGTKMNFVYRFFPLESVHPNAVNAAKAGYAASLQGKFWEMHDKLFETQDDWASLADPEATFVGYAKNLDMNIDAFKKVYEASTSDDLVNNDYNTDTAMGLNSTPTFFLNGKELLTNPNGYDDFKQQIQSEMK